MGVKLFVRTTRSVRLTAAGAALVEPTVRCLRLAEETVRAARGEKAPAPTELGLGTRHELGLSWILPAYDHLQKARRSLCRYLAVAFGHLEAHELSHLPAHQRPPAGGEALGLFDGNDARQLSTTPFTR